MKSCKCKCHEEKIDRLLPRWYNAQFAPDVLTEKINEIIDALNRLK